MASKIPGAVLDGPVAGAAGVPDIQNPGLSGSVADVQATAAANSGLVLPIGFRRLSDLRKRSPKASYEDLKAWIGKTIRLDGVNFQTETKDGKIIVKSGEMTFSEFDPTNPDRETDQTTTTQIPRSALRALYEGLTKNPDETIVCDVTQGKRGLSLQ